MNAFRVRLIAIIFFLGFFATGLAGQFPDRQIEVIVTARPQKAVFAAGEPILVDVEIKNGLKAEIIITAYSLSPNEWNGETLCIELPDIYRLPNVMQIYLEKPKISPPKLLSGAGGYRIPKGKSKVRTIDVSKWRVTQGWIPGKYQVTIRVDKIDVDKYTWINVNSDPIVFEVR